MVRELCEVRAHRSGQGTHPGPPGRALHDGRVHTDIDGATPIDGLFAAGETACVTINGANRLGPTRCRSAWSSAPEPARLRQSTPPAPSSIPVVMRQADDEVRRLDQMRSSDGGHERIADIREEMQSTMEDSAGIFRSGDSLAKGIDQLAELQQRLERVQLDDQTMAFNTELVAALELANMLDIAETTLHSAVQRGVPRRPSADRLQRATCASSTTRWPIVTRTVPSGSSGCR